MIRNVIGGMALAMFVLPAMAENFQESVLVRDREIGRQLAPIVPRRPAPNRIVGRKTNVSGALVTIAKARQPLHAINPCAPAEYGSGFANVARDPITGQADGIMLLSIEF
ncbi:MAG TPA: hypothetical protein PLU30_02060 [Verrucomicrobiae bacterium]|nr:hypothetical protein [Verrucomicrobiae bacterium]